MILSVQKDVSCGGQKLKNITISGDQQEQENYLSIKELFEGRTAKFQWLLPSLLNFGFGT